MDRNEIDVLKGDLQKRYNTVERIYERILGDQSTFKNTIRNLESMAYQIHNLYGACEELFEIVATTFENQVASPRYQADLLIRMQTEFEGIRPAFISPTTYKMLNKLRRFHHFFRHAYGAEIEADKLDENVRVALQLREQLRQDMESFIEKLR